MQIFKRISLICIVIIKMSLSVCGKGDDFLVCPEFHSPLKNVKVYKCITLCLLSQIKTKSTRETKDKRSQEARLSLNAEKLLNNTAALPESVPSTTALAPQKSPC